MDAGGLSSASLRTQTMETASYELGFTPEGAATPCLRALGTRSGGPLSRRGDINGDVLEVAGGLFTQETAEFCRCQMVTPVRQIISRACGGSTAVTGLQCSRTTHRCRKVV
jgi:hypothetical protein